MGSRSVVSAAPCRSPDGGPGCGWRVAQGYDEGSLSVRDFCRDLRAVIVRGRALYPSQATVMKNQSDDVSQSPVRQVTSAPPATGSPHRGRLSARNANNLVAIAP